MIGDVALFVGRDYRRSQHLASHLELLGLSLEKARSAADAKQMLQKRPCSLILVHFDTVDSQIFELCSFVQAVSNAPILIVLMDKVQLNIEKQLFNCRVNDVVAGLQTTVDVLIERIKAHLRNRKIYLPSIERKIIMLKGTIVDLGKMEVYCNGVTGRLRGLVGDLLEYFIAHPDHIVSRDELLQSSLWADSICSSADEGGKTFDVAVGKLRKLIEPDPARPQIITTVRGKGWLLARETIVG